MELIELTQNSANRTPQQSNIKPVSSGFKEGVAFKLVVCIGFNFKHEYAKQQRCHRGRKAWNEQFWKRWLKATTSALSPSVSMKSLVVLFKLSKLYGRKFDFSGIPKYIMVGKVPFHMVFLCRSCFPVLIVNLSILTNDEILVHSGLIEIFSASHTY